MIDYFDQLISEVLEIFIRSNKSLDLRVEKYKSRK